jgi:hypothetical protein
MLPRFEIEDYVVYVEDDEELQFVLASDGGHICPAAIGCIQAKHVADNHIIQFNFDFVPATSSRTATINQRIWKRSALHR